jgi:Tetratricopeptide repeat
MGQYPKAEPLELRALRIYEKVLGPDHPDTATAAGNLGRLYCDKGEFAYGVFSVDTKTRSLA